MNKAIDPALMQAAEAIGSTPSTGLEAWWMPFTANRQFKQAPRLLARASGMHYWDVHGREILDGVAGLWCVNAGHARPRIVQAIQQQAAELDFAPTFQMGHPKAFELAERLASIAPAGLNRVFFANSGSEAVETALKIALAYHRVRGEGTRTRLIGRERGYHGADFADDLERLVALHDASNIAAVIVEPVAGSTGVLVPPVGYLQRLREICTRHGILLIFDEVITGFGRTGQPFAAQTFGVVPDMITCAKGINNGCVPMGAVLVRQDLHDAFMTGPEHQIEFFHGYTYSAHPLACAAALGTLDTYAEEGLLTRAGELQDYFAQAVHSLQGEPNVIDIRNIGLVGGIELAPLPGEPTKRAFGIFLDLYAKGLLVRTTGDTVALSPPLIIERGQIDQIVDLLRGAIRRAA